MTDAGWPGEQQRSTLNVGGPHYDGPRGRLGLLGKVASGLILADVTAGRIDSAVAYSEYLSLAELADDLDWAYLGAVVVAGVVFLGWLWRARQNSELLSESLHSRSRGWVIGGWLVPFVNLVSRTRSCATSGGPATPRPA